MMSKRRTSRLFSHTQSKALNPDFEIEVVNWGHFFCVFIILLNQANYYAKGIRGIGNGFFGKEIRDQSRNRETTRRYFGQFQMRLNMPHIRVRFRGAEFRGRGRKKFDEMAGVSASFEISEMILD